MLFEDNCHLVQINERGRDWSKRGNYLPLPGPSIFGCFFHLYIFFNMCNCAYGLGIFVCRDGFVFKKLGSPLILFRVG